MIKHDHMRPRTKSSILSRFLIGLLPMLRWWHLVHPDSLRKDMVAGITGAVIVLPQGVAYAMIAGLPPQYGLYTAIIVPIVAGLFGSSHHLVSGPAAPISIVVMSIISGLVEPGTPEFITMALTLTFMVGVIQLAMGLARMGNLVNFISHTVIIGFTAGAAILIATSQFKYLLGLTAFEQGNTFYTRLWSLLNNIEQAHLLSVWIGLATMAISLAIRYWLPRWPNILMALIGGGLICFLLNGAENGVLMIGSLPGALPPFSIPDFSIDQVTLLMPGAVALAMLASIGAVSISKAIALRSGQRIRGNQELIGQGLSNVVGGFFSCYTGSGSFTRTGANYDSGAATPLSCIFAAIVLAAILWLLPSLTQFVPFPAMAATIILMAYNLIDHHAIISIVKQGSEETTVFAVTFLATLFIDLEFAIYIGILSSLIIFLQKVSTPTIDELSVESLYSENDTAPNLNELPNLKVIRINGPLFFGSVDHIRKKLLRIGKFSDVQYLIINCAGVNTIDLSGGEMLSSVLLELEQKGIRVFLTRLKKKPLRVLRRGGFIKHLDAEQLCDHPGSVIIRLHALVKPEIAERSRRLWPEGI